MSATGSVRDQPDPSGEKWLLMNGEYLDQGQGNRVPDGDLGHFTAYARYLCESGAETRGIADFYDELAGQRTETIAKSLSRPGSLDTLIRSLSDAEILRLLTRLADLFADLEEQRQFESAALISTVQDRVRDEHGSRVVP